MGSRYSPPLFGSNNPSGVCGDDLPVLPSIDCGNEIVYQSVYNNHNQPKSEIRVKLVTKNDERIKDIRLVHLYSNSEYLYIVDGDGKLYGVDMASKELDLQRIVIDQNEDLEVLQIASYTESVLFIVRDKISGESFIYGRGHNGYFRNSHERANDYTCSKLEIMFEPRREMTDIGEPYVINHIGCCYSFSCCIMNDTLLHFSGQNWLSSGQTHVDGYFTWTNLIQDVKKPVAKIECGDFHVVLLHKDGSVSVGGSNSSDQLTSFTPTYGTPFTSIFTNISNIYSGSNTVIYQIKKEEQKKWHFYFSGSKSFDFVSSNKDNRKKKRLVNHRDDTILEQQFTRDYFIHRYEESPKKLYVDGSSYYGSNPFANTEICLDKIMPFEEFNKGFFPKYRENDFYKEMVKVILQPKGMIFICDYGRGLSTKIFTNLLNSTDHSCENNRLLLDLVIHFEE